MIFDVNRRADAEAFCGPVCAKRDRAIAGREGSAFRVTLITNENATSSELVALRRLFTDPSQPAFQSGLSWPPGMFALSHSAADRTGRSNLW